MFRNYLIVVLRFFSRQRGFSIINISGLTIGIACSLLILLYIQDEYKFDRFHRDSARIHRVGLERKHQGKVHQSAFTSFPLGDSLQQVENVESVCRIANWPTFPASTGDKSFTEPYLLLADSNFFTFFSFPLIEGDSSTVLTGERKLVLSESAAKKYFGYLGVGYKSPVGKKMYLAQGYEAVVAGIAADPPLHSHFHFSIVLSLASWERTESKDWLATKVITYFKLKPDLEETSSLSLIKERLGLTLNHALRVLRNTDPEEYKRQGNELTYFTQPITRIHLHSHLPDEIEANGNIDYIYLFAAIACFITLLACINFMNLTTAQSASRAKEVAVRKTVGAQNDRLITQFLLESYFYVFIAVAFALFFLLIALGPFNYLTQKNITFSTLAELPFVLGILVFVLATGLVAGSYPSFYLTHFSPVQVLKGNLRSRLRTYGIRNVLVVFQFMISTGLIIATLVVYSQLRYVHKASLGFDKENIINLLHTRNLGANAIRFKEELQKHPGVVAASYANRLPPNVDQQGVFRLENSSKDYQLAVYEMDYDHLKTMGYQMIAGRFFSREEKDSAAIIINETAARKMGLKDFEGKKVVSLYDGPQGKLRNVIGIIQDFNFQSLKNPIQPMAVIPGFEPNLEMAIRVHGADENIAPVQKLFQQYAPGAPFEYTWLSRNFDNKLESERKIGYLFIVFTVLAIIIACLGLFGLAAFTAEQQRKEIGIRMVLGATASDIVKRLNKGFLTLVLIATIIAWPTTWWLMRQWLGQFAYHTNIGWWIFVVSALITFVIAFTSVTLRALKAAARNPVNSLRSE